jgi:hypothetical protein
MRLFQFDFEFLEILEFENAQNLLSVSLSANNGSTLYWNSE